MLDKIPLELFQNIILYLDTESSQELLYVNKNTKIKYENTLPMLIRKDVKFIKEKLVDFIGNKKAFNDCFVNVFKHKCNNLIILGSENNNIIKIYTSSKNLQFILCQDIYNDIYYLKNNVYYNNSKTHISVTLVKTLIS